MIISFNFINCRISYTLHVRSIEHNGNFVKISYVSTFTVNEIENDVGIFIKNVFIRFLSSKELTNSILNSVFIKKTFLRVKGNLTKTDNSIEWAFETISDLKNHVKVGNIIKKTIGIFGRIMNGEIGSNGCLVSDTIAFSVFFSMILLVKLAFVYLFTFIFSEGNVLYLILFDSIKSFYVFKYLYIKYTHYGFTRSPVELTKYFDVLTSLITISIFFILSYNEAKRLQFVNML